MIKVQLIVVQGKPEGKTIPLTAPVFRIGRDPDCQLRPSSEEISRHHAEISIVGDTVTVKDMGSRNGTFLNGKPVKEPTALKSGDLVKVAHLTFAVSIQGAGAGAMTPSPSSGGVKSLEEVPADEVASWLIADDKRPVPDRPSAVYAGDTMTIDAYKGKSAPAPAPVPAAKPEVKAPEPAPAKPVRSPEPEPAPAPAPVAETEDDLGPLPLDDLPESAPTLTPAPPTPPPVEAKKTTDRPPGSKVQGVGHVSAPPKSILDELDSIEFLPEGEGDSEPESYSAAGGGSGDDDDQNEGGGVSSSGSSSGVEEEWMDESNPFYVAKKKAQEGAPEQEAAKPSFKDSSEAANAILKKMLERRKAGGGGGNG